MPVSAVLDCRVVWFFVWRAFIAGLQLSVQGVNRVMAFAGRVKPWCSLAQLSGRVLGRPRNLNGTSWDALKLVSPPRTISSLKPIQENYSNSCSTSKDDDKTPPEKHRDSEKEPLPKWPEEVNPHTGEKGGPKGPEPTRYGDWERKGRVTDF